MEELNSSVQITRPEMPARGEIGRAASASVDLRRRSRRRIRWWPNRLIAIVRQEYPPIELSGNESARRNYRLKRFDLLLADAN